MRTCKTCIHHNVCLKHSLSTLKPLDENIDRSECKEYLTKSESKSSFDIPCKIGDTVYLPYPFKNPEVMQVGKVKDIKMYTFGQISVIIDEWKLSQFCPSIFRPSDFNSIIFLDKEVAKSEMKRIKEEYRKNRKEVSE